MIARRNFVLGGLTVSAIAPAYFGFAHNGYWTALKRKLLNSKCDADCFGQDWMQFEYNQYYHLLFDLSRSDMFSDVASGPVIKTEMREAFGGDHLHAAQENTLRILSIEGIEDFTLIRVRFKLDCGVPVKGCIGVPRGVPRGLVLLAHGMGTTPERCFNVASPDYMEAIGARLCAAGFAVWCPFMPQSGNEPSVDNLAGMFSLAGISYHNVVCSALNLGPWVASQMKIPELRVVRYGMSWGSLVTCNLEAATGALKPSVLSGYLRDEDQLVRSGWLENRVSEPFLTYLHQLPGAANYFFPGVARLVRPCRLYFEIGDQDELNNNTFGRDDAFAKILSAYREVDAADAVKLELFSGGHEVAGTEAIAWLSGQTQTWRRSHNAPRPILGAVPAQAWSTFRFCRFGNRNTSGNASGPIITAIHAQILKLRPRRSAR